MSRNDGAGKKKARFTTKKCPYCSTYVKHDADRCEACKRRIGPPNEYGVAKKPVNVVSYLTALGAVAAMVAYFFWAFVK
jgi:methionyl-tRNA synthetase